MSRTSPPNAPRRPSFRRALAASGAIAASTPAWAAPAAGDESATMGMVLVLLAVVGAAYLLAHLVVDWVQRRLLIVSGFEYVFLGMLLGPVVLPSIHILGDLTALAPIIAFAAGWVGLLYGMELDLRTLITIPDRSLRLAAVEVLVSFTAVAAGAVWFFRSGLFGLPPVVGAEAWMSAGVLGAVAAAASSSAVDLVYLRYPGIESRLLPLLRRTARLEDLLAIVVYGLLFCVFHISSTRTAAPPAPSDWVLLTLGLGLFLGLLFVLFLGEDASSNTRFLALVGIIVFASGAAFFLNISALLVNLVLGVVIVNTRQGVGVYDTLQSSAKPVRLILLVFAGALWVPVPLWPALVFTVGFVLLRLLSKMLACLVAALGTSMRNDVFRGLLAQGEVAVAMAIAFRLVYAGPTVDLVYTAVLGSFVFYEAIAPRLLKGLLVDAGELGEDVDKASIPRGPVEYGG